MIWHLFTLAFVILKLTGLIAWPWLYVLAPSIAVFAILCFLILLALVCK